MGHSLALKSYVLCLIQTLLCPPLRAAKVLLLWPFEVLLALITGPRLKAWSAKERDDRWWWGQHGLGNGETGRATYLKIKLVSYIIIKTPPRLREVLFAGVIMRNQGTSSGVYEMFDSLLEAPTLKKGAEALEMKSVSEWLYRPAAISHNSVGMERGYTHPLMRPILFLPGLRSKPFYDVNDFAWVKTLEASFEEIRNELKACAAPGGGGFQGYIVPEDIGKGVVSVPNWRTLFFVSPQGKKFEDNIARCPKTWEVMNSIPGFVTSSMTMFSSLNPGGRIQPHAGLTNGCLRVHLGVVVPEPAQAIIRVGDEVRTWEEGKVMIFNDAFDHEVWHNGSSTRSVLFFDVWHPDLTKEDLAIIEPAWGAIKATSGQLADDYEKMARVEQAKTKNEEPNWFVEKRELKQAPVSTPPISRAPSGL